MMDISDIFGRILPKNEIKDILDRKYCGILPDYLKPKSLDCAKCSNKSADMSFYETTTFRLRCNEAKHEKIKEYVCESCYKKYLNEILALAAKS
jgi:hypothetical protein